MANLQSWQDFNTIKRSLSAAASKVRELHSKAQELEDLKAEIIDDTVRKDELVKILTIHPDYSLQQLQARLTKLATLKQYLEDNGYTQL